MMSAHFSLVPVFFLFPKINVTVDSENSLKNIPSMTLIKCQNSSLKFRTTEFVPIPDFTGVRDGTTGGPSDPATSWTTSVARLVLTILLRIGFPLVQMGSVPVTNVNLIMLHNVVDFSCVTLVYVLGGYVIAYGGDLNGLMGEGRWIGRAAVDKEEAIIGWQAISTASAICTSCLVGRTHTVGYLFVATLLAGVLEPFVIHWAWTPKGWMTRNSLREETTGFRDYGGSAIVHVVGSLSGLMGCMILGRRILRLRDIDDASVSSGSAATTFAGYLLILLGLQGLCLPSTSPSHSGIDNKHMSHIVVNNLLGASACSLVVVGLHFFPFKESFNHWTVMRCVQASIAGVTIVSAGVNVYTPVMCVGLGCTGGIVFYLVSRLVFQSALEDYCNIVATHLTCALVGCFFAPFCRPSASTDYGVFTMLFSVAWQVICLVAIVTLVAITMSVAFALLECFGLLRNRSEFVNHLRAVVALERGPTRSYLKRIFLPDSETLYLQPGTAPVHRDGNVVSQRFANYERALVKPEKSNELRQATQRSLQPEVVVASAKPLTPRVLETRVKKFRQVHTMRSTNEQLVVPGNAVHEEAMGDNRIQRVDCGNDEKNSKDVEKPRVCCSGDVAEKLKDDESLIEKFATLNSGQSGNTAEKSLKRRREPYRLHRTEKFMNLQLEAISEYDENVEILVKPRPGSFSSTESESDDEFANITPRKYSRSVETSVRPTLESREINLSS